MDCRQVVFSPEKSQERIHKALQVFPRKLLMRIMAFALHLLGAKRKDVATLVAMPEESVKTLLTVVMRDAFPALRDRRCSSASVTVPPPVPPPLSVSRDDEGWNIAFNSQGQTLSIPANHPVQARTIVLSLLNVGAISAPECASVLGISTPHCRTLARQLAEHDVAEVLIDKREGQKQDYRMGTEQKAELIQQLVARAITGHSTSSEVLAEQVSKKTQVVLSPRTARWHLHQLGLSNIRKTLPQLVEALKKTPVDHRQYPTD